MHLTTRHTATNAQLTCRSGVMATLTALTLWMRETAQELCNHCHPRHQDLHWRATPLDSISVPMVGVYRLCHRALLLGVVPGISAVMATPTVLRAVMKLDARLYSPGNVDLVSSSVQTTVLALVQQRSVMVTWIVVMAVTNSTVLVHTRTSGNAAVASASTVTTDVMEWQTAWMLLMSSAIAVHLSSAVPMVNVLLCCRDVLASATAKTAVTKPSVYVDRTSFSAQTILVFQDVDVVMDTATVLMDQMNATAHVMQSHSSNVILENVWTSASDVMDKSTAWISVMNSTVHVPQILSAAPTAFVSQLANVVMGIRSAMTTATRPTVLASIRVLQDSSDVLPIIDVFLISIAVMAFVTVHHALMKWLVIVYHQLDCQQHFGSRLLLHRQLTLFTVAPATMFRARTHQVVSTTLVNVMATVTATCVQTKPTALVLPVSSAVPVVAVFQHTTAVTVRATVMTAVMS
jgi:hypothetical protein